MTMTGSSPNDTCMSVSATMLVCSKMDHGGRVGPSLSQLRIRLLSQESRSTEPFHTLVPSPFDQRGHQTRNLLRLRGQTL